MQRIARLAVILMFLFSFTALGFSQSNSQKQEADTFQKVNYFIDFMDPGIWIIVAFIFGFAG